MTTRPLAQSDQLPGMVNAGKHEIISSWVAENADWEKLLYTHGYVLFRGFDVADLGAFDAALDALMEPSQEFAEETSPRSGVGARVFTSTDYPREYPIQFHHEFSYRQSFPGRLAFGCMRPAEAGGSTPLADSRKVLQRLPIEVSARFEAEGVTYIRNFSSLSLGVSWPDAFGTRDRSKVSQYCEAMGIEFTWSGDDLRTSQTAAAVVTHPVTGERAWFNSALNLNVAGTEPEPVRDAMLSLPADMWPTSTTYGSGDPIAPEILAQLRQVYADEAIRFDWQAGDVLCIDNVLTAHARDPFEGERSIVVGMGSPLIRQNGGGQVSHR